MYRPLRSLRQDHYVALTDPDSAVFRDPWWMFTCITLFHVIRKCYGLSVIGIIGRSPRLGILLAAIFLAMVFTLMDILATAVPRIGGSVEGYVLQSRCLFRRLTSFVLQYQPVLEASLDLQMSHRQHHVGRLQH